MGYRTREPIRWHEAEKGMHLESPYRKEFVAEMKDLVPHRYRRWDKDRLQWWISDLYLDEVDNLLFTHFEQNGSGRY